MRRFDQVMTIGELAKASHSERHRVSMQSYVSRYSVSIPDPLFITTADDAAIPDIKNCAQNAIPCDEDTDCGSCAHSTAGSYVCKNNTCVHEAVSFPPCSFENGCVYVFTYDSSLNTLIPSPECIFSNLWTGPSCTDQSPMACGNGTLVKVDGQPFQWTCKCDDGYVLTQNSIPELNNVLNHELPPSYTCIKDGPWLRNYLLANPNASVFLQDITHYNAATLPNKPLQRIHALCSLKQTYAKQ